MDEQKHFKSMILKPCNALRMVTGVRAQLDAKSIQVSIDAKGPKTGKRFKNFAKNIKRLEKDLKKTFPKRKLFIHIWATSKKLSLHKMNKPFRGRNIVIYHSPIKL